MILDNALLHPENPRSDTNVSRVSFSPEQMHENARGLLIY
jgi:hypothetical protein